MPKLLIFAACEKVILDQKNVISLMSLLQEVTAELPAGVSIVPQTASAPWQWTIVSIWEKFRSDQGKTFEQRSAFVTNTGVKLLETPTATFEFKGDYHRIISQIAVMPIGISGKHLIKAFLRENGSTQWEEVGVYPLEIKWITTPSSVVN